MATATDEVLEAADLGGVLDDEGSDDEFATTKVVSNSIVIAVAVVGGVVFGLLRPSLTDSYDGGLFWGQVDWLVMGTALWAACLLALNRVPWSKIPVAHIGAVAVSAIVPLWANAQSGPLLALVVFGAWLLALTVLARVVGLDGRAVSGVAWAVGLVLFTWTLLDHAGDADRVASTLRNSAIAVLAIGGLWIGLNLLTDQAKPRWTAFAAGLAAVVAAAFFGIVRGNQGLEGLFAEDDPIALFSGTGFLGHFEWSIVGAIIWGGAVAAITLVPKGPIRIGLGAAAGIITGYLIGNNVKPWVQPRLEWAELIVFTLVGLAVGAALRWRTRNYVPGALLGAAVGWTFAAWFTSRFGGSSTDAIVAAVVPLTLLGARLGWGSNPDLSVLSKLDQRARAAIFLGPALLFITAALFIPAIITIILSFKDRDGEEFVGLDNYGDFLGNEAAFNVSNWTNIFTSQLTWVGVALVLTGLVVGIVTGQKRHGVSTFEGTGSSLASISIGVFLFLFAVLSVLRGTFFNNLWWVLTVTTMSTVLGLTIAVLAERAGRLESLAKSLIFMPMAVSFVGASIVWRLQYQPRDVSRSQTGLLNAGWVELGRLSHSGWPRLLVLLLLAGLFGLVVYKALPRIKAGETFGAYVAAGLVVGYLFVELLRRSLGGFRITSTGEVVPDTVLFIQNQPFNNVFLMIILIWIQTGFAMVILSAAIKAVPEEFIEAAKVDGATESQIFFRITLPQILPTIGVIVTTLIVLVTKVFDIVKVTTNGNFGTNVLANDMYTESFSFFNQGLGAAIAVFILISVLPVMFLNIRRMQQERSLR